MANYHNKITREQALNLVEREITDFEVLVEGALGAYFSIPIAGDSVTDVITTIQDSAVVTDGNVSTNTADIATNVAAIAVNTSGVATNVLGIADNVSDISDLVSLDGRAVVSNDGTVAVDVATSTEYDLTVDVLGDNNDVTGSEPGYVLDVSVTGSGEHTANLKYRTMPSQAMSAFASGVSAGTVTPGVYKTSGGPCILSGEFTLTNFVIDWDLSASEGTSSDWMNIATLPATYNPTGEGSAVSLYPSATHYASIVFFANETSSLTEDVTLVGVVRVTNAGSVDIKVGSPFKFNSTLTPDGIDMGFVLSSGTDWIGQYTGSIYLTTVTWDWE